MRTRPVSFRACPVCQSKNARMLCLLDYALFDDLNLPGTKRLLCCLTCGMLYDDVEISEGQLAQYYRSNEHYAASSTGGTGSFSEDNNRRYDRILDSLQAGPGDLIVDYGCGQGGLVAHCRALGLQAAGIEASAASLRTAVAAGLDVSPSLDEFSRRHTGRVHAVVFSHILEHLLDPLHSLRQAASFFTGALFYLEVPDVGVYLASDDIRWDEMYFEHFNHFRRESLHNLAASVALDIIDEGRTAFSPELKDVQCLTLKGRASCPSERRIFPIKPDPCTMATFPFLTPSPNIPEGPLALWGISQYAMLLLGTVPELLNQKIRLFDASPAKIGRSIRGLWVEPSESIRTLDSQMTLLIPRSRHLDRMLEEATQKSFRGLVLAI